MMKLIGKKFMKSAACFSVLCALVAGLSVSNLHASASGTSQIGDSMTGGGPSVGRQPVDGTDFCTQVKRPNEAGAPFQDMIPQSRFGQNITKSVKIEFSDLKGKRDYDVISVDFGDRFSEVQYSDSSLNAPVNTLLTKNFKGHTRVNTNLLADDFTLVPDRGDKYFTALQATSDNVVSDILDLKRSGSKWSDKELCRYCGVFSSNKGCAYSLAPLWLMSRIQLIEKSDDQYATYKFSDGRTASLTKQQYQDAQARVQFSAIVQSIRLYNSRPTLVKVVKEALEKQKKLIVSLTCSDALEQYGKDCLLTAMKCVFESAGNVKNLSESLEKIKSNGTKFIYQIVPRSLAVQAGYFKNDTNKNSKKQNVVMVRYGYNTLSICRSEYSEEGMTVYPDQYFTDCGGKLVDEVLSKYVEGLVKKSIPNIDLTNDTVRNKILLATEELKEKISERTSEGSDSVTISFGTAVGDCSVECLFSGFKELLEEKGIVGNFEKAVQKYIDDNKESLGNDFDIAIAGGNMHIPRFQGALEDLLRRYTEANEATEATEATKSLKRIANKDELCASGAGLLFSELKSNFDFQGVQTTVEFDSDVLQLIQKLIERKEYQNNLIEFYHGLESDLNLLQEVFPGMNLQNGERFLHKKDIDGYIVNLKNTLNLDGISKELVVTNWMNYFKQSYKDAKLSTFDPASLVGNAIKACKRFESEKEINFGKVLEIALSGDANVQELKGVYAEALKKLEEVESFAKTTSLTCQLLWILSSQSPENSQELSNALCNDTLSNYVGKLLSITEKAMTDTEKVLANHKEECLPEFLNKINAFIVNFDELTKKSHNEVREKYIKIKLYLEKLQHLCDMKVKMPVSNKLKLGNEADSCDKQNVKYEAEVNNEDNSDSTHSIKSKVFDEVKNSSVESNTSNSRTYGYRSALETFNGFSSTVWSYVKPVLSAPLRVFNWVRSWFW